MKKRPFGPTGQAVSIIGQGTWYIEKADRAAAVAALQRGLDLGLTHIDTAEMYGSGAAEAVVGEAIAGRRDEVFLVSKVLPSNASRRGVVKACEASLRALGTDYLDGYLLHWRGSIPLAESFAAFEKLQQDGKIRCWGVSNFDAVDLQEAWDLVGPGKIACNQVLYHLQERAIEHAVLPWCRAHDVAVVAYSPFGHGDFPAADSSGGRLLRELAQKHRATPRQIALAFLTRDEQVFAIPKAAQVRHVQANAGAASLSLDAGELAALERAFPLGDPPKILPMI